MGKFLKPGRLVVCLAGRFAGKKAVILRVNEDGSKDKKFGHALVVGLSRYPRKVTKRMSQLKIRKRTCVKAFVKFVNLNHVMPTRYRFEEAALKDIRERVSEDNLKVTEQRKDIRKNLRKYLAEKYRSLPAGSLGDKKSQSRFLFSKLRF